MIAMDSGNGHLAALYGVPVITLWGNTHPYAGFAPYAQPQENQLTANREQFPLLPTSIFGDKIVAGYENVTDTIEIKAVIERLKVVLDS
jgi:ADP-heptose:LPS heptosyltransferase